MLGANLVLKGIQDYIHKAWKGHVPSIQLLPCGVFMMKFQPEEDMTWVLEMGPWMVDGIKPFMLRK